MSIDYNSVPVRNFCEKQPGPCHCYCRPYNDSRRLNVHSPSIWLTLPLQWRPLPLPMPLIYVFQRLAIKVAIDDVGVL